MFNKNQTEEYTGIGSQNQYGAYENATIIQFRLDTDRILMRIEDFLASKRRVISQDEKGNFYEKEEQVGKPLANKQGVMMILHMMVSIINPQNVQGNYTEEHYWSYIGHARCELVEELVINRFEWGIADEKVNNIVNNIMRMVEPFISRLIGNEERKSYMQQFQTREVMFL